MTVIAPTRGNAPVPTQGGVGATPGFDAIDHRRYWSAGHVEGVLDGPAFKVSESAAAPDMNVLVRASVAGAFVEGDSVAEQGLYYVPPHNADISLAVTPADATNPRIDRVVLKVRDADFDASGVYEAAVEILDGSPTAGATLDNQAGAVPVPDTALYLSSFVVAAGATAISNADIRDFRLYGHREARVGDLQWTLRSSLDGAPPPGWKFIGGTALRAVHHRLFDAIGTRYGAGDGSTTFQVGPPTGTKQALLPEDAATTPGTAGGEETHTLTEAEQAVDNRQPNDPGHDHDAQLWDTSGGTGGPAWGTGAAATKTGAVSAATTGITLDSFGGGQAHNNMPPYAVVGAMIVFTGSVAP